MTKQEFIQLNPLITNRLNTYPSKEELRIQGEYLKTHKFIFDTLTSFQAEVIKLRCGVDDGKCCTLDEVGLKLNISKERVRQIQDKAFEELRDPDRIELLMKFDDTSIDRQLLEQYDKTSYYTSRIRRLIRLAIKNYGLYVINNINTEDMPQINNRSKSVKKKLIKAGITDCEKLLTFWKIHENLEELGLYKQSENALIWAICKLINSGNVGFVDSKMLIEYDKCKHVIPHNQNKINTVMDEDQQIDLERKKEEFVKSLVNKYNDTVLEKLNLSLRLYNCFKRAGLNTLGDVIDYYYKNNGFKSIKNLGTTCESEMLDKLCELGIDLNIEDALMLK